MKIGHGDTGTPTLAEKKMNTMHGSEPPPFRLCSHQRPV